MLDAAAKAGVAAFPLQPSQRCTQLLGVVHLGAQRRSSGGGGALASPEARGRRRRGGRRLHPLRAAPALAAACHLGATTRDGRRATRLSRGSAGQRLVAHLLFSRLLELPARDGNIQIVVLQCTSDIILSSAAGDHQSSHGGVDREGLCEHHALRWVLQQEAFDYGLDIARGVRRQGCWTLLADLADERQLIACLEGPAEGCDLVQGSTKCPGVRWRPISLPGHDLGREVVGGANHGLRLQGRRLHELRDAEVCEFDAL
mmetsp:Transcript_64794/g.200599  ORF Transcript_64794/g.200599 Transcript_64794/m.200599 type:complete len:259 (+) Transcript_64794:1045-1821(+)